MGILVFIVIGLSGLVIIFQNPIADFLLKYIFTKKLGAFFDRFFLSKQSRERARAIEYALMSSPIELKDKAERVIRVYGKKYSENVRIDTELLSSLPSKVKNFFLQYDYLKIGNNKVLDVKYMEKVRLDTDIFIRIGNDKNEDCEFFTRESNTGVTHIFQAYAPGTDAYYEENNVDDHVKKISPSYFEEFENFIFYMYVFCTGDDESPNRLK